ncbi:MAG: bifunctional DNA-formamidopyrimidine glycosylase/DNA-(apurinic or apyrimidinic site) lyase [Gammaproteobacteria bacterium]|jgi:formamidopyrimidine-DNA glycosylase
MPELPEVETIRRGLEPLIENERIMALEVRDARLRWPVAPGLDRLVRGKRIVSVDRRAKYLLLELETGCLMIHLGMSGSLRYLPEPEPPLKHDHFDLVLESGAVVRYNDPRRFGSLHLTGAPGNHELIRHLGPEPLESEFDGEYLWRRSRNRKTAIKQLIMNGEIVVGVGNIYANEALFRAGIHPSRPAGRISRQRLDRLCEEIRSVLEDALRSGGTTLRDFVASDGRPGYFRQRLSVYEREGAPCRNCGRPIRRRVIGQRASYFCPACQR